MSLRSSTRKSPLARGVFIIFVSSPPLLPVPRTLTGGWSRPLRACRQTALLRTVIVGAVNVLATFVSIATVDVLGRRPLLLAGGVQMVASLVGGCVQVTAVQGLCASGEKGALFGCNPLELSASVCSTSACLNPIATPTGGGGDHTRREL